MAPQLPDVVLTYFDVSNGGDVAQIAGCFCSHATVFDEGKTHKGIAAIEAWQQEARRTFIYQVQPLQVAQGEGRLTVIARLTGNFPGSPVQLSYVFTLEDHRIYSLEITPCRTLI